MDELASWLAGLGLEALVPVLQANDIVPGDTELPPSPTVPSLLLVIALVCFVEPPGRKAGVRVANAAELIAKLKEVGALS